MSALSCKYTPECGLVEGCACGCCCVYHLCECGEGLDEGGDELPELEFDLGGDW